MPQYSKNIRAQWHNYNGGLYFVTFCTKNREHYFGEILKLENFENHLINKDIDGLDLERFISEVNYFFRKCQGN